MIGTINSRCHILSLGLYGTILAFIGDALMYLVATDDGREFYVNVFDLEI